MVSHLSVLFPFGISGVTLVDNFTRGGFLGVDIFFVLSGFLITALLLREEGNTGSVRLGSFYIRRALRLLPALYLLLAAHLVYVWLAGPDPAYPASSLHNEYVTIRTALVYLSNWQSAFDVLTVSVGLGHLWSLAVEEQFYLIWPLLLILFLGLRKSARTVTTVLVLAIVVLVVHRSRLWLQGTDWIEMFVRTDTRVDSMLVGALVASLWVRRATPTRGVNAAAWGALIVVAVSIPLIDPAQGLGYLGGLTVFAAAVAIIVLALVDGTWAAAAAFGWAPLRLVGRVSYGLYLWHLPVFFAVERYFADLPGLVRVAIALGLTATGAALSWFCVERPALRYKAKLEGRPTGSLSPT